MENQLKKDGFIMYSSHWAALSLLSDEEMGKLMKSVYQYYLYNRIPEFGDKSLNIMFNLIKQVMDKDKLKYITKCNKNKESKHGKSTESVYSQIDVSYFTDKDKDKEKEKDKDNNKDIINAGIDIKSFIKEFGKIRGKTLRAGHYIKALYKKRLEEGYTVDDMYDTLRSAMQEDFHIANNFARLTPGFILSTDTLDIYTVLKRKGRSETKTQKNLTLGTDEWIKDGQRFYRYHSEIYQIPVDAPGRPGIRYVYDHEKNKWILPGNF